MPSMQRWNDAGHYWTTSGDIWPYFTRVDGEDARVPVSDIRITLLPRGADPLDLTPLPNSLTWTTAAVGGYGSCTFSLVGLFLLPYLAKLIITRGELVLFEGRIEDIDYSLTQTNVQVFGYARLMDDASVRRVWSTRDLSTWRQIVVATGTGSSGSPTLARKAALYQTLVGQVDPADGTKIGVEVRGNDGAANAAAGDCNALELIAPPGLTYARLMADLAISAANHTAAIHSSSDGASWTNNAELTANGSFNAALVANAKNVRFSMFATAAQAISSSLYAHLTNLRVLGTSIVEDSAGGFYGDTLLRDLLSFVPGLTLGVIESATDFVIEQIERSARASVRDAIDEVTSYYARELAVWEDARVDWKTPNLDEPQWLLRLSDLSEMQLQTSMDKLTHTSYVVFANPAEAQGVSEQSTASTDQRNPFVKGGDTRDEVVSVGFPMTDNSALQLSSRLAADHGAYPPVSGKVVVPANRLLRRANGSPQPAYTLRGGDNIVVEDLPKSEPLRPGRDGETLFHIVSTEQDLGKGSVTLTLEGQSRRTDVLLARLAAATRTVTG